VSPQANPTAVGACTIREGGAGCVVTIIDDDEPDAAELQTAV
jgi:hypothetical protein